MRLNRVVGEVFHKLTQFIVLSLAPLVVATKTHTFCKLRSVMGGAVDSCLLMLMMLVVVCVGRTVGCLLSVV